MSTKKPRTVLRAEPVPDLQGDLGGEPGFAVESGESSPHSKGGGRSAPFPEARRGSNPNGCGLHAGGGRRERSVQSRIEAGFVHRRVQHGYYSRGLGVRTLVINRVGKTFGEHTPKVSVGRAEQRWVAFNKCEDRVHRSHELFAESRRLLLIPIVRLHQILTGSRRNADLNSYGRNERRSSSLRTSVQGRPASPESAASLLSSSARCAAGTATVPESAATWSQISSTSRIFSAGERRLISAARVAFMVISWVES